MAHAGSQARGFYRDVAKSRTVWTVRDDDGYPAPMTSSGQRAQPFWSSRARAEKVIATVAAYSGMRAVEVSWQEFCEKWIPQLVRDNLLAGVNWSGPGAVGFDYDSRYVQEEVDALIDNPPLPSKQKPKAKPKQKILPNEPFHFSSFGFEGQPRFTSLPDESGEKERHPGGG